MTHDYNPSKDGAESYNAALKAIRMEKIRAGEINPIVREVIIGDCRLIQGDCLEVMQTLGKVDAVVADPPYGIGMSGGKVGKSEYERKEWDNFAADVGWIVQSGIPAIIWGGNYFNIVPSEKWLVWDKKNDPTTFADCELAWTNISGAVRVFRWLWSGPYQEKRETRFHPTQKPVALMQWCLGFLPDAKTILDPFMGSGTTLVACAKMGRKGIGIELDPDYFDIACERVRKAYAQPDFFVAPPEPKPVQEELL